MCGLAARVMECAAGGRPYSGCEPSFAGAGMAGREVRVGCDAGSTGQPGAIRPVKQALLGAALKRPGARDTCARPGCCGRGPPDALEPCRARRGTHLGWGCQCSVITARYCPASLSS